MCPVRLNPKELVLLDRERQGPFETESRVDAHTAWWQNGPSPDKHLVRPCMRGVSVHDDVDASYRCLDTRSQVGFIGG
jgi:hypothetical protein